MSNSSIWPLDRTLSGATTPSQSVPRSNSNEKVLHIPQSSRAEALPSDCLISYPGLLLGVCGPYLSAEMQSEYSTATANWATGHSWSGGV